MLTARIVFKKGHGHYFCPAKTQDVVEMKFESPEALMEILREFKDSIHGCTAQINGKIIDLRSVSGLE